MLFVPPMRDHLPWETTIWSSLGVHGLTRQGPLQSKCGQNDCSYIQLKLGHLWHFILTFVWSVDYVTGLVHPADYTTSLVHPEINAVCLHTSRPAFKLMQDYQNLSCSCCCYMYTPDSDIDQIMITPDKESVYWEGCGCHYFDWNKVATCRVCDQSYSPYLDNLPDLPS